MRKGEMMMKIIAINPIPFKKRMIEFLFDYLFILAYLVLLFLSSMLSHDHTSEHSQPISVLVFLSVR